MMDNSTDHLNTPFSDINQSNTLSSSADSTMDHDQLTSIERDLMEIHKISNGHVAELSPSDTSTIHTESSDSMDKKMNQSTSDPSTCVSSPSNGSRSVGSPVPSSSGINNNHNSKKRESSASNGNTNANSNSHRHGEKRAFNQRRTLKFIDDQDLDEDVIIARREEEDRLKRLLEAHQRQRMMQQQQQLQQQQLQQQSQQSPHPQNPQQPQPQQQQQASFVAPNYQAQPKSCFSEEIVLSSDDDGIEDTHMEKNFKHISKPQATPSAMVIDLSDEEDNHRSHKYRQDNSILGSEQDMLEGTKEIPENGLHTDDSLNLPDSYGRVLINVAHPEQEADVFLSPYLSSVVKAHQIGGIRFLYDCVVESMEKYRTTPGLGCILAHSMGLGKTLQTIAFIEVFLRVTEAKHVLCIVPVNTLQNWLSEFEHWLPKRPVFNSFDVDKEQKREQEAAAIVGDFAANVGSKYRSFSVFSLGDCKTQADRSKELLRWRKEGGVMFLGYEMYRIMLDENALLNSINRTSSASLPASKVNELIAKIRSSLLDPGPDLIVCDEGHRIKNAKAAISKALKEIKTKRRIVLTGYPLQNNLIEYWCMVDFIRPGYLGTKVEFCNLFERPITNGQCVDSTPQDKIFMRKRSHVLYQLLKGFVQRRSQSILTKSLPTKFEYVICIRMTDIQKQLFLEYFNYLKTVLPKNGRANPLVVFSVCVRIWNHPDIFLAFMNNEVNPDEDMDMPMENNGTRSRPRAKRTASESFTSMDETYPPLAASGSSVSRLFNKLLNIDWARPLMSAYEGGVLEHGYKMCILFEIIEQTLKCGDRLLVFSHSLKTLDVIEHFLGQRCVPGKPDKFRRLTNYFRLDGSTNAAERERFINEFNANANILLFLLSTKAGSLGINLIGANRIVVFDASWNPCHDAQAACRIYRFGQQKKCYIYRLVCDNTLEKRIYDRQITKQGLSNRVVDELNSDSYITMEELTRLVDGLDEINEPPVLQYEPHELRQYSDHIVQRICAHFSRCLTKQPFEHESLLLDVEETKLSRDEKRIAEIEFKMERKHGQRIYNGTEHVQPGNSVHLVGAAGETIIQPGGAPSMDVASEYQYHQPPSNPAGAFNLRSVRLMPGVMHPSAGQIISQCVVTQTLTILDVNEQVVRLTRGQTVLYYQCPPSLIIVKTLNGRVIPMYQFNFEKYFGVNPGIPVGANSTNIPLVTIQQGGAMAQSTPEVIDLSSDDDLDPKIS